MPRSHPSGKALFLPLCPSNAESSRGVPRNAAVLYFPLLPDTVSPRRVRRAHVGDQARPDARSCTALPRLPVDVYAAPGQVGQARFSLEKQKGNPGAASVPLGPSGHPKLSDGRVAAGGGARLAAVDANSATVAVSSPALSAPVRRAAGPARRQTSEIQVVLKRRRKEGRLARIVRSRRDPAGSFRDSRSLESLRREFHPDSQPLASQPG